MDCLRKDVQTSRQVIRYGVPGGAVRLRGAACPAFVRLPRVTGFEHTGEPEAQSAGQGARLRMPRVTRQQATRTGRSAHTGPARKTVEGRGRAACFRAPRQTA